MVVQVLDQNLQPANGGSGGGSDAYGYPSSPSNMATSSGNTPPVGLHHKETMVH